MVEVANRPWEENLECPHCHRAARFKGDLCLLGASEKDNNYALSFLLLCGHCPSCAKLVALLREYSGSSVHSQRFIIPNGTLRKPAPIEVPEQYAKDYAEACLVLECSPQSSGALGRRILQHIIRDKAGICERNLDQEIQKLKETGTLPPYLTESLDAVRNIGNLAAHPTKNESTGEILPVSYEEAEWTLDVIESLFDFYFVQPAALEKKRIALNEKLKSAGKQSLK